MKKYLATILILSQLICCHSTKNLANEVKNNSVVASHKGNGTSIADAVILQEVTDNISIEVEEKAWLAEKYPGYEIISTGFYQKDPKDSQPYFIFKIKTVDGAEFEVYFDASAFNDRLH